MGLLSMASNTSAWRGYEYHLSKNIIGYKKINEYEGQVRGSNGENYIQNTDQPGAIAELVEDFREGSQCQTLLGVTGSGKTFTMANVIQQLQKPTLIIAHNKTLAGQLYGECSGVFCLLEWFWFKVGAICC